MYNKPKSKIRLTNLGKWLIFLAFFLLFSAQNTGNNLLYLVCSCFFTAICFGFVNILSSSSGLKAEIIYPKLVGRGQKFDIVCKIAKNDILTRYYIRFEDGWLESLKRGQDGYLRQSYCFEKNGRYVFTGFSIIKPSMLDIFYYHYIFPDFVIYVDEDVTKGNFFNSNTNKLEKHIVGNSVYGNGDFYSLKAYQEGEDASYINWVISAKSSEEWVVLRENEDERVKDRAKAKDKDKESGSEDNLSSTDSTATETFFINGKKYSELMSKGIKKSLNSVVYRIMVLLALLTCFGVYNTGFIQSLTLGLSIVFIIFGIRGKALPKAYHNFIYIICVGVGLYILLKSFSPHSPVRIILLMEFSMLILTLQYLTMVDIRNLLCALTLVLMIILGIAAMNMNSAYPIIFFPFLLLTSMILTFFRVNLVSTEDIISNSYAINPRGVVGTLFLLIIFSLVWIPFFYLIPRTKSYGIASELSERRTKGFSGSSMSLKESGYLEDNLTVVMRVIPNEERTESPSLLRRLSKKLIRGGSFFEYENGEWKKRRRGIYVRDLRSSSGEIILDRNYHTLKNLHSFDVVLENQETVTVFVPYGTKVMDFPQTFVGVEPDGAMFYVDRLSSNKRYTLSMIIDDLDYEDSDETELEQFEYDYRVSPYLSLNGTTDKIQYLANNIMEKTNSIKRRAELVIDYLKKNCSYSLEQPELVPGEDPVEKFLFGNMAGTCQHYSTAMVFLLRCMGIPSRVVNGYIMNEWNETGGFFTVRQSNAHAWVEVFFPKSGWIPFDPTPADDSAEPSKIKQIWDKIMEVYEGYWFNYIYSFDQNTQFIAKRNYLSKISHSFKKIINSPFFLIGSFIVFLLFLIFYRYLRALYSYFISGCRWLPFPYVIWENKTNYCRRPNETPSEYHKRLYLDKIIDERSKDILSEVEELIDEFAFNSRANKNGISRKIKQLLADIKL